MAINIKDVALLANVGIGTVSRVINREKSVSAETREKVLASIKELGYIADSSAVKLRRRETRTIALLIPVINHPFFSELAFYVEDECDKHGYSLLVINSQRRKEKELLVLDKVKRREVDGVIFVTHYEHDGLEIDKYPIISIDRHVSANTPYVTCDNYDASMMILRHLKDCGCKNIAFIGGRPAVESEVSHRLKAYEDFVKECGMPVQIFNPSIKHGEEAVVAAEFFNKREETDGIFVSGDGVAQAIFNEAERRGIRMPDDIKVASFDGTLAKWSYGRTMTSAVQPLEEMGRAVVNGLIGLINKKNVPLRQEFKASLVIGSTTIKDDKDKK